MKPNKAALHNLKHTQQQKQQKHQKTSVRTLKVAIVVKPDGDWIAVGGNAPESDRMAKALWGTPDGSLPVWAVVQVELPGGIKGSTAPSSDPAAEDNPAPVFEDFVVAPAPAGAFVGPGDPLPVIDIE